MPKIGQLQKTEEQRSELGSSFIPEQHAEMVQGRPGGFLCHGKAAVMQSG